MSNTSRALPTCFRQHNPCYNSYDCPKEHGREPIRISAQAEDAQCQHKTKKSRKNAYAPVPCSTQCLLPLR